MTLPAEWWSVVSAIASGFSAVAAAVALGYTARQLRLQARATAFQTAERFLIEIRQRLDDCKRTVRKRKEFGPCVIELVASFELFCVALNDHILSSRARRFVTDTLIDYLDDMNEAGYGNHISGLEAAHVCCETKAFVKANHKRFRDYDGVRQMLGMVAA